MAFIDASDPSLIGNVSPDEWEGATIMPFDTEPGAGIKVTATTNRDILLKVAGIMVPMDSLSIQSTEDIKPVHGATRALAYALAGGDIDINYSVEFGTWLSAGEQDALRNALFEPTGGGRAVYHTITVTYMGDPAKGYAGRHPLLTVRKAKAKSDSWNFAQGSVNKSKFDGLAIEYFWYGRTGV